MLAFPNAKINLGLHVLRKRDDGFHDIETCLFPIPFTDILEILPATKFSFNATGLQIEGDSENNICFKAYELIRNKHHIGPVSMHLHKVIPMGAGLGGGSSDGAFALKMLNTLFELKITNDELKQLAGQLGSDCPLFIDNQPAIATGTGTSLTRASINLKGKFLLLAFPKVAVSTKAAYAHVIPAEPDESIEEIIKQPISNWKAQLLNDFEKSVFLQHPELANIKMDLYDSGAIYAAMSGSGSTLFALFEDYPQSLQSKTGITTKVIQL